MIYLQKLYAKAIYDNYADTPDELPFKKGDILTVIEQDTEGIQGWWLCSLRNRQVSWLPKLFAVFLKEKET